MSESRVLREQVFLIPVPVRFWHYDSCWFFSGFRNFASTLHRIPPIGESIVDFRQFECELRWIKKCASTTLKSVSYNIYSNNISFNLYMYPSLILFCDSWQNSILLSPIGETPVYFRQLTKVYRTFAIGECPIGEIPVIRCFDRGNIVTIHVGISME
jgi:hypothetical protein